MRELHALGISHGDLYAHNILARPVGRTHLTSPSLASCPCISALILIHTIHLCSRLPRVTVSPQPRSFYNGPAEPSRVQPLLLARRCHSDRTPLRSQSLYIETPPFALTDPASHPASHPSHPHPTPAHSGLRHASPCAVGSRWVTLAQRLASRSTARWPVVPLPALSVPVARGWAGPMPSAA